MYSGMAITYALLGLLIASAGAGIQGWLQNPWLLSLFSVFYLALALSLFFRQRFTVAARLARQTALSG